MSDKRTVRGDEKGIFVYVNGGRYRPGAVSGVSRAYDMSDGGLKIGDRVVVRHVAQTPLAKIVHGDRVLHWHVSDLPAVDPDTGRLYWPEESPPKDVTYRLSYRAGNTNCCVVERSTGSEEHTGKSLERLFIEDVKYWMETEPRDTYNIEIVERVAPGGNDD